MAHVPKGMASGMMAGILLPFGLNAFKSIGSLPLLGCGMIAAYLVFKRLLPRYSIVLLLVGRRRCWPAPAATRILPASRLELVDAPVHRARLVVGQHLQPGAAAGADHADRPVPARHGGAAHRRL